MTGPKDAAAPTVIDYAKAYARMTAPGLTIAFSVLVAVSGALEGGGVGAVVLGAMVGAAAGFLTGSFMGAASGVLISMIVAAAQAESRADKIDWGKVPGAGEGPLRTYLKEQYRIDWAEQARICKVHNGEAIHVSSGNGWVEIRLSADRKEAAVKTSDGRTDRVVVRDEGGELSIYGGGKVVARDQTRHTLSAVKHGAAAFALWFGVMSGVMSVPGGAGYALSRAAQGAIGGAFLGGSMGLMIGPWSWVLRPFLRSLFGRGSKPGADMPSPEAVERAVQAEEQA